MDVTRASLIYRVRDPNDDESWREFYEIYQPLLYRYARARGLNRETAEEITQQCMAMLSEKMATFEYSRDKGGFKNWLRRVTNNKIIDYFKKKKVPLAESAAFRRPQEREESPDELWDRQWRKRHLKYCLQRIRDEVAPSTYQAFEYYVLAEWPVEKVCQTLGVTTDQVYTAKTRITRRLRAKMTELLGEDE